MSPGCEHCYAEALAKRYRWADWGKGKPRRRTSEANWKKPLRWNKTMVCDRCGTASIDGYCNNNDCETHLSGVQLHRPRVFCASLADWLDDEVPIEWLSDLLKLIHDTPNLDWLLLTKRPENWRRRIEAAHDSLPESVFWTTPNSAGESSFSPFTRWLYSWLALSDGLGGSRKHAHQPPHNIWIGTTIEDQQRADERIPELLKIPARVRFLSCEPLLERISLRPLKFLFDEDDVTPTGNYRTNNGVCQLQFKIKAGAKPKIDWVICGGESGRGDNIRPMHPQWARSLRDQCVAASVPFLFKQWGEWAPRVPSSNGLDSFGDFDSMKRRDKLVDAAGAVHCTRDAAGEGYAPMSRVGKKAAGRLLDGRQWNEFPTPGGQQ